MNEHPALSPLDVVPASLVAGSLLGYLPPLAAALAIIWYCVLLYDRFKKK